MLVRFVKMTFKEDKIDIFLTNFNRNKEKIRAQEGCHYLELLQDQQNPCIFFTRSKWSSEAHLNQYRTSELFKTVWAATKVLFDDKPAAWSLSEQAVLP